MSELPAALAPWGAQLSLFPRELALALGPLVRRLAAAIGPAHAPAALPGDVPDGYDGLDRRGDFERLLLSEWLLADELWDEFARRAAMHELAFLKTRRRSPAAGRTAAALLDCGPDQLGAPRLAQIAALIVLARRADTAGWPFVWAAIQDPPGQWREGFSAANVRAFLDARSARPADAPLLDAWRARVNDRDDLWWIGGARLVRTPATRGGSTLTIDEPFEPDASHLEVRINAGAPVALELPDPRTCVRLLRDPFRSGTADPSAAQRGEGIAIVSRLLFAPGGKRLWTRSADGRQLLAFSIPNSRNEPPGKVKKYDGMPGEQLLAVDGISRSLVLVFIQHNRLRITAPGRRGMGLVQRTYELDPDLSRRLRTDAQNGLLRCIAPGSFDPLPEGQPLWIERGAGWWVRLALDHAREEVRILTPGQSLVARRQTDASTVLQVRDGRFQAGLWEPGKGAPLAASPHEVLFGYHTNHFVLAYRDETRWWVDMNERSAPVEVAGDETVIGVVGPPPELGSLPLLVTLSPARRIVRLVGPDHTRVLPGFGGKVVHAAVSNDAPLLAVALDTGEIVVWDLMAGEVRGRIPVGKPAPDEPEVESPGRDASTGLPNEASARRLLEKYAAEPGPITLALIDADPPEPAIDALRPAFRGLGTLCRVQGGLLLLLPGKPATAVLGPLRTHDLAGQEDAPCRAVGIVEAQGPVTPDELLYAAKYACLRASQKSVDRFESTHLDGGDC